MNTPVSWGAVAMTALILAFGLKRQIRRFFCNHPKDRCDMYGGALYCKKCGGEVTLWE